jgi:hypothetical protein
VSRLRTAWPDLARPTALRELFEPTEVTIDTGGNVLFTDADNNWVRFIAVKTRPRLRTQRPGWRKSGTSCCHEPRRR